jgi:hypothetical protein
MRIVSVSCLLLLFCGFALGQATIIGGTASTWTPAYGVYLAPYVPLVTTPEVSLSTVSPAAVGASNATFGLVAGATNGTLSPEFVAEPPAGVYTQPNWYVPSMAPALPPHPMQHPRHTEKERQFDFIAQSSEGGSSVVQMIAGGGPARKASRTYTNQDVDRVNQTTGTVKYRGKTEHI